MSHFIPTKRTCKSCHQPKPIKGGKKINGVWQCEICAAIKLGLSTKSVDKSAELEAA